MLLLKLWLQHSKARSEDFSYNSSNFPFAQALPSWLPWWCPIRFKLAVLVTIYILAPLWMGISHSIPNLVSLDLSNIVCGWHLWFLSSLFLFFSFYLPTFYGRLPSEWSEAVLRFDGRSNITSTWKEVRSGVLQVSLSVLGLGVFNIS